MTPPSDTSHNLRLGPSSWPADARKLMNLLDTGMVPQVDRRATHRQPYRVAAVLSSLTMEFGDRSIPLYIRDAGERAVGFIARRSLASGTRCVIRLPIPGGTTLDAPCTIRRCKPVGDGWFEGAVTFSSPQPSLSPSTKAPPPMSEEC